MTRAAPDDRLPPPLDRSLCARCVQARPVRTERGSVFLRCGLSTSDPRFAKYPHQPVVVCAGFVPAAD